MVAPWQNTLDKSKQKTDWKLTYTTTVDRRHNSAVCRIETWQANLCVQKMNSKHDTANEEIPVYTDDLLHNGAVYRLETWLTRKNMSKNGLETWHYKRKISCI